MAWRPLDHHPLSTPPIFKLTHYRKVFPSAMRETLHMGLRQKSARFLKLAKENYKSEADRCELVEIMKDIRRANKERNFIVHGSWAWGVKPDEPWLAGYREKLGKIIGDAKLQKPKDIKSVAARIDSACNRLIAFLQSHGVESPPL